MPARWVLEKGPGFRANPGQARFVSQPLRPMLYAPLPAKVTDGQGCGAAKKRKRMDKVSAVHSVFDLQDSPAAQIGLTKGAFLVKLSAHSQDLKIFGT